MSLWISGGCKVKGSAWANFEGFFREIRNKRIQQIKLKQLKKEQLIEKKNKLMKLSNQKKRVRKITGGKKNKHKMHNRGQIKKKIASKDMRYFTELVVHIRKLHKAGNLPAILFIFSKKVINSLSDSLGQHLKLMTSEERKKVSTFFEKAVKKLKPHDRDIYQLR
jgi:superfamily II RNA helicase